MSTIWAIGASVRALAQCLAAAGHEVVAADLFNDLDLQQIASITRRIGSFPYDLLHLMEEVQADAFVYAGGLENYPDLIDALADRMPLLGNQGHVLRRVRDAFVLRDSLTVGGFQMPPMSRSLGPSAAGAWLRKSMHTSGGLRVGLAGNRKEALRSGEYFQAFVEGAVYGASFKATAEGIQLLGTARQLTDCPWTNAPGFQYAGSIGPVELTAELQCEVMRLGETVAAHFDLQGWFGIDFIVGQEQQLWVLEVNPRYTASMELLTRKQGPLTGKAILYSTQRLCVTSAFVQRLVQRGDVADIPRPGSDIAAGSPTLTLFAEGLTERDVVQELQAKASTLQEEMLRLGATPAARAIE